MAEATPTAPAGEAAGKLNPAVAAFQYSPATTPTRMANRGGSATYDEKLGLREALRKHLNYYFSDENLAKDTYLVSQMDSDLHVSTAVIASFRAIQSKTTDTDLILDVLRSCENVLLNQAGTQVRPRNYMYHMQPKGSLIFQDIDSGHDVEKTKQYLASLFAADMYGTVAVYPDGTGYGNRWYVHIGAGEAAALDGMKLAFSRGIPVTMKPTNSLKEGQTQGLPQAQATAAAAPQQYTAPPQQVAASYPTAPAYMATPYGYYDPQQAQQVQQVQQTQQYGYYAGQPGMQMMSQFGMYGYPGQYPQGAYAVAPSGATMSAVMSAQPAMYRNTPVHGYAPTTAVAANTAVRPDGAIVTRNGGSRGGGAAARSVPPGVGFGGVGQGHGVVAGNRGRGNGFKHGGRPAGSKKMPAANDDVDNRKGKRDKVFNEHGQEITQAANGNSNPGNSKKGKGQQPNNTSSSSTSSSNSTAIRNTASAPSASSKQPLPSVEGSAGAGDGSSETQQQQQQKSKKTRNKAKTKKPTQDASTTPAGAKAPELALNNFPALPGGLGKAAAGSGAGAAKPKLAAAEWKMADIVSGKSSPKRNGNNNGNSKSGAESKRQSSSTAAPSSITPPSASGRGGGAAAAAAAATAAATATAAAAVAAAAATAAAAAAAAVMVATGPTTATVAPTKSKDSGNGAGAGAGAGADVSTGEHQQPKEKKKKPKGKGKGGGGGSGGGGGGDGNFQDPEKIEKATPASTIAPPELGGPIVGRSADDTGDTPKKSKAPKVTGAWGKSNTIAAVVAGRAAAATPVIPASSSSSSRNTATVVGRGGAAPSSSRAPSAESVPRSSQPATRVAAVAGAGAGASAVAPVALHSPAPAPAQVHTQAQAPASTPTPAPAKPTALAPAPVSTKSTPAKASGSRGGGGGAWGASSSSTTPKPSFAEMLRKQNEEAAPRSGR